MAYRIGIIGCGAIAVEHLEAIREVEGLEPFAYCDIAQERARALLDRFGGAYATDDVGLMMADDRVDAVYICTYHDTHLPFALAACEAGKHVMMEKPMDLSVDGCRRIGEAVEESGVTLMTAFKLHYYPMVERARQFLPEPVVVTAQVFDARWPDEFWAQDPVKGGGNVQSQGCHAMDLICYLNGSEPRTVHAEGGVFSHGAESPIDTITATVRFANGRIGSVTIGDCGQTPLLSKFSAQLVGGGRSVHLHDRLRRGHFFDGESSEEMIDARELGMIEENRRFVEALRTATPPPTTHRHGLRATAMIAAAFASIRTGQPQPVAS